jgi:hypothetical protein
MQKHPDKPLHNALQVQLLRDISSSSFERICALLLATQGRLYARGELLNVRLFWGARDDNSRDRLMLFRGAAMIHIPAGSLVEDFQMKPKATGRLVTIAESAWTTPKGGWTVAEEPLVVGRTIGPTPGSHITELEPGDVVYSRHTTQPGFDSAFYVHNAKGEPHLVLFENKLYADKTTLTAKTLTDKIRIVNNHLAQFFEDMPAIGEARKAKKDKSTSPLLQSITSPSQVTLCFATSSEPSDRVISTVESYAEEHNVPFNVVLLDKAAMKKFFSPSLEQPLAMFSK